MSKDGTRIGSLKQVVELRARIAELEAAVQAGRDLMAIVHGDGGHYREAHGDRKAADDAIAIVINLRAELAAERERREAHTPRPVVAWFSGVMEERLRANDHKGGWSHCSRLFLLSRLYEEVRELDAAVNGGAQPAEIENEAANVANFAMMVADVCGGGGRRHKD